LQRQCDRCLLIQADQRRPYEAEQRQDGLPELPVIIGRKIRRLALRRQEDAHIAREQQKRAIERLGMRARKPPVMHHQRQMPVGGLQHHKVCQGRAMILRPQRIGLRRQRPAA
jgi:type II secretory pathway component PulJ